MLILTVWLGFWFGYFALLGTTPYANNGAGNVNCRENAVAAPSW